MLPLPPLPTQRAIAARLDRADALRQKDRQLLQEYDALAEAVFVEMFGDPVRNEKGWEVKRLGDLGTWKSGGTPSRSNNAFFSGSIPWLSSGELNAMYVTDSIEKITEEAIGLSAAKKIEIGSLLLGMYDTAALKSTITKSVVSCNQAIAFCKFRSRIANTEFIYFAIQLGRDHFRRQQRGVRQKNMNLTMIRDIEIIFPPLSLQNRFAGILTNIEQQKALVRKQQAASEALFGRLLQEAFGD